MNTLLAVLILAASVSGCTFFVHSGWKTANRTERAREQPHRDLEEACERLAGADDYRPAA